MSKWYVSEQSIFNENGQQIIEASEWYMHKDLQKICDEHNYLQTIEGSIKPTDDIISWLQI